jgi:hypothetical protein
MKKILPTLAVLSLVSACGVQHHTSQAPINQNMGPRSPEIAPAAVDGSNIQGLYNAKFVTMNPHVNGNIPGSLTFYRKDDRFSAYVRMFAGGAKAWHQQNVYMGNRCPTIDDDENKDGFIDIVEAKKVLGKIIIPLDADLNSQSSGRNFFPLGDATGSYYYERDASFRNFFRDLKSKSSRNISNTDDLANIPEDEGLALEGKVVMVQGVADEVQLPDTVATIGRRKVTQTLPVTCGIIWKVTWPTGTPEESDIPGPIAPVEEGQDHPAPDAGPTDPTGGATAGTTGRPTGGATGTNETNRGQTPTSNGNGSTTGGETTGGMPRPPMPTPTPGAGGTTGGTTGGSTTGGTTGGSTTGGSTAGGTTGETTGETTGDTGGVTGERHH